MHVAYTKDFTPFTVPAAFGVQLEELAECDGLILHRHVFWHQSKRFENRIRYGDTEIKILMQFLKPQNPAKMKCNFDD